LIDAPINVGWGSKQTQFHGSLGKAAAAATSISPSPCPDDDSAPRISWRADGTLYAVSIRGPTHRIIRIYSRTGVLQSTSEPTPGLGHPLAWRPSGSLIASVHRPRVGKHEIVFFERNGLRKGEFSLRDEELVVRDLYWNADSTILAAHVVYNDGKESSASDLPYVALLS
jgi:elongator complex protein 1